MASFLIAVFILVFLWYPVLTYTVYWYEVGNSAYKEELARKSGRKTALWILKGFLTCMVSQILFLIFYPLALLAKFQQPQPGPKASHPPIILIHGIYHNASAWIFYWWWLKRAGYTNVYAFNYDSWKYTFREILDQLDRWISEIHRDFPNQPILLMGHSLGGLFARAYAGRSESRGFKISGIITLGSPHQGSKLVVFGGGKLAESLTYRGTLIRELEEISMPSGAPCLALYSPVDNLVLPPASLQAPHGWQNKTTDPVCHISMLYHGPTFRRVLRRVRELTMEEAK